MTFEDLLDIQQFLSTPSARRATKNSAGSQRHFRFLSTPSARRATVQPSKNQGTQLDFYPRPPRGGRPACGHYKPTVIA